MSRPSIEHQQFLAKYPGFFKRHPETVDERYSIIMREMQTIPEMVASGDAAYSLLSSVRFRCMLDNIQVDDYIGSYVSDRMGLFGNVKQIIRNIEGIPVCLAVYRDGEDVLDYISVELVSYWFPSDKEVEKKMVLYTTEHLDELASDFNDDKEDTEE